MNLPFFVYGTLMPGQRNWRLLQDVFEHYSDATATGWQLWHLRAGNYPAITPGEETIEGVLVWVGEESYRVTLRALDDLEGYSCAAPQSSLYLRQRAEVITSTGAHETAWIYVWNPVKQAALEREGAVLSESRWEPAPSSFEAK